MLKLFVLQSNEMPDIYVKAASSDSAKILFQEGFTTEEYGERINNPTFTITEIDQLSKFLELIPDEFQIVQDVSF